ncbi:adenylate cyclase [Tritrichomonas foetus]|uniref:Adenylate cyclase n=1 Tax=Tritrichomonas foetus TaxID=1144522 RepID=A0A1J4KYR2_9EUKA|nr:adenylate cyclase [Tritrichomonas foetus]|eukprot:OHT16385.1 adenylate cyclase [Tritrichomonas foetus]
MNDANKLLKILTGLDSSMKEDARKPIRKDFEIEMAQLNEKKPKGKKWILFISELILCSAASALVAWAMIWEADNMNDDLKKLTYWHLYSVSRLSYVVEGLHYMLEAVLLNGTIISNVSNQETLSTLSQTSIVTLNRLNDALLKGVNGIPPCYEYDDELDDINFQSACIVPDNDTDLHDIYRCSSASQGIGLLYNMISTILNEINTTNGDFSQIMIVHSIHLVNCHLLDRLYSAIYRLEDLTEILCDDLETNSIITLVFGIVVSIIVFLLSINFYTQSVKVYNIGLTLTQRVPPTVFISNKQLMNFVLNRKNERDDVGMSTAQGAIFMSNDAILCTNVTGVVEIVNPAVTAILGYTPDQLLGQAASSFFSEKDADTITNQLELMKNGQSSLVYEDHMSCITDSAMEMPCGVTVLGMMNESKNTLESFVIIIRDETILMKQQKDAELAKEQSENLLFQILPRDIVVRLNRGEKDICFTVPSASIIFTDVVRFSEYAKNLQPQEIMGSLSTLFAAFDNVAKKYPLLTKIKLIGDIYMAAAGLFSTENDQPKAHAEQIINFGIDQLTELEEVNVKLNANLQLRIGINSGGPLLAGVLGTDKPVFDIIGDPINVAARLQTTDVPGKIQIPQSTYDLAHEGEFQIEARGEVFLKGKGKTMAYLITPQIGNVMSFDFVSLSKDA